MAKNHWQAQKGKKGLRKWTCYYCDKYFSRSHFLKDHRQVHLLANGGKYPCRHCEKKTKTLKEMKSHIRKMHGDAIECKECDKKFGALSGYNAHMK